MNQGGLRRSASFTAGPSDRPARPSRIPTLVDPTMHNSLTTPTLLRRSGSVRLTARSPTDANHLMPSPSVLRRTGSMRLPSKSPTIERPDNKEVWGIGSGSWGKRQQQLRRQQSDKTMIRGSGANTPLSCRGSNTSIDRMHLSQQYRRPFEDDEDLCSEMSYDSTMSVDRLSSRRYMVHCSSDHNTQQNGKPYLTPTQRTTLLNKELKAKLKQALDDCSLRDMEISRLTQECVELRMKHARLSISPDVSPVSPTPPGIEKDSLNSSLHSELPLESVSVSIVSEDEPRNRAVFEESRDKQSLIQLDEPITPNEKLASSGQIVFQDIEDKHSAILQLDSNRQLYSQSEDTRLTAPFIEESQSSHVVPSHRINVTNEGLVQFAHPVAATKHSSSFEAHITQQRSPSTREVPTNNNLYTRVEETYVKPARPDILNLNFSEDGRGQQPDNCLFNSLPAVFQVPVWQEKCVQSDETPENSVIQAIDGAKKEDCQAESQTFKEMEMQTDPDEMEEQLKAAQEALIETKVQLSRLRSAAESSQADVTLKFLKSAFYHLVTDSSQGMALATKSHWRAIQSILGFSQEECEAMDSAVATGTFPGSTW